jgi:DNA-binding CsgD family transcriptional regulator
MTIKTTLTPREKEVQMLYARGKSPDMIAIRLNMILTMLSMNAG